MLMVQQEELKRKLRQDYSQLLYAIVATRGILLQLISEFTVISIFASTMSLTPIFVHSERLDKNLPEVFITEPFTEARAQEHELLEESELIRSTECFVDQNCVPNPKMIMVDGAMKRQDKEIWDEIEEGNNLQRQNMRAILAQPPRTVDEWVVLINGIVLLCTESRFINYCINLYKYILTIGVLVTPREYLFYWMVSAVLILVPFCMVTSLKVAVMLGKAMNITDNDLGRALRCMGLGFLFDYVTQATGSSKELDLEYVQYMRMGVMFDV